MKKIELPFKTCTACGACASICPKECINMEEGEYGFYYPSINNDLCINCRLCEKVCHIITPEVSRRITDDNFYMFWLGNVSKRQSSTSGGAFTLFSKFILDQGGIVFGSYYNLTNERVEVGCTDNVDFEAFKKSKYVESYVGTSAKTIGRYLQDGRYVLYCGTPCQVAGIRKYLNTKKINQERLILIDFACHGVPTSSALRLFKRTFETSNKKLSNIDFRYKDSKFPWHSQTMKMYFTDGTSKIITRYSFYYYYFTKAFNLSINLRQSCYNCNQVGYSSADITIGDFWDIIKYKPELDDNKGISFIKFHNSKWLSILNTTSDKNFVQHIPDGVVTDPYNKKSKASKLPEREKYLKLLFEKGCLYSSIKYFGFYRIIRDTYISGLFSFIKNIIIKIKR